MASALNAGEFYYIEFSGETLHDCQKFWRNFVKPCENHYQVQTNLQKSGGYFVCKTRCSVGGEPMKLMVESDFEMYSVIGIGFDKSEDALAFVLKWL